MNRIALRHKHQPLHESKVRKGSNKIKRYITIFATLGFLTNIAYAAPNTVETSTKTKLEQFSTKTGVVLIRGFQKIGSTQGLYNTSVNVQSKEFVNVSNGEKEYGITIEAFEEKGTYDKQHTSYIDFDEIDSLIAGIDYISKIKPNVTKMADFQADYTTRGDLKISTFSSGKKVMAAVQSGKHSSVSAYFNIEDLQKIKTLLLNAKKNIEVTKA